MVEQVERSLPEEQLALLREHPDLGTRARVSEASSAEQEGAGLDQLTQPELERLRALNEAYRDKFRLPFLFAVKGSTKHDILGALERRVRSPAARASCGRLPPPPKKLPSTAASQCGRKL